MKKTLIGLLIAIIIVVGGGLSFYYGYYVKTPQYTLQIIAKSVQDKDVKSFNEHVDVKSVVGDWVEQAVKDDPNMKNNPIAHAFLPAIKEMLANAAQESVNNLILGKELPANKNAAKVQVKETDTDIRDAFQAFQNDKSKIEVTDISSDKMSNGDADIKLTLKNKENGKTMQVSLIARELKDGTWQIYKTTSIKELEKLKK